MIIMDFREYGAVEPRMIDRHELVCIYQGACDILANYSESAVEQMLTDWEMGLAWNSLSADSVDDDWYSRALLTVCLRGLRGERKPDYIDISAK